MRPTAPIVIESGDMTRVRLVAGLVALAALSPVWPARNVCAFRWLTGAPCPFCGLTTSVRHTARLRLRPAFRAHPFGPLGLVAAIALLVHPPRRIVAPSPAALAGAVGGTWVYKLISARTEARTR